MPARSVLPGVRPLPCFALATVLLLAGAVRADPVAPAASAARADAGVVALAPALAKVEAAPGDPAAAEALARGRFSLADMTAALASLRRRGDTARITELTRQVARAAGPKYWGEDFDLLGALQAAQGAHPEALRVAVETVCILHALAADGTTPAVLQMAMVAPDHAWAFRPEVTRRVRALGERARAGLILAQKVPHLHHFASTTLESIGVRVPGDAVQTKSNAVLVDVLGAYAANKDLDGLGVVLSFVGSAREPVREAARAATLEYGVLAAPRLREMAQNLDGAPPPPDWDAARLAHAVFATMDRSRNAELDALVEEGLTALHAGRADEAVTDFDKALARQPMLPRRAQMAPAYVAVAQEKEGTDHQAARAAYRKALELDPGGPHAGQIRGALAYLEGEDLRARGIEDRAPYERAIQADPSNADARARLAAMDDAARKREDRQTHYEWAAGLTACALAAAVMVVRRRRR